MELEDGIRAPLGDDTSRAAVRIDNPWLDPALAQLYDDFPFGGDVPFYLGLAKEQDGPVLELACGSGRLLEPLAAAGHSVVGVDVSPHMLALARRRLAGLGGRVESRCRLVQGDLRSFELEETFALAIVAVRSFSYLLDRKDQQAALHRIFDRLWPNGILVLDLLNPSLEWLARRPGVLHQDLLEHLPDRTVMRTEATVSTDLARQVRVIRSIYDVVDRRGIVTRRIVEWPFRYFYRFEAELLMESAGFTVQDVFGGYDQEAFAPYSPTMLLLGRAQH